MPCWVKRAHKEETPMVFVIETDRDGHAFKVSRFTFMSQALPYIAAACTRPEEDEAISLDVVTEAWEDASRRDEVDPYQHFVVERRGRRYGLAWCD